MSFRQSRTTFWRPSWSNHNATSSDHLLPCNPTVGVWNLETVLRAALGCQWRNIRKALDMSIGRTEIPHDRQRFSTYGEGGYSMQSIRSRLGRNENKGMKGFEISEHGEAKYER